MANLLIGISLLAGKCNHEIKIFLLQNNTTFEWKSIGFQIDFEISFKDSMELFCMANKHEALLIC